VPLTYVHFNLLLHAILLHCLWHGLLLLLLLLLLHPAVSMQAAAMGLHRPCGPCLRHVNVLLPWRIACSATALLVLLLLLVLVLLLLVLLLLLLYLLLLLLLPLLLMLLLRRRWLLLLRGV
jgi:hypothetical protein